jgi:hypothetical protein
MCECASKPEEIRIIDPPPLPPGPCGTKSIEYTSVQMYEDARVGPILLVWNIGSPIVSPPPPLAATLFRQVFHDPPSFL